MNTALFPVVHIHERSNTVFAYSYDVAEVFGRSHKDFLRDLRRLKEKNENFTAHICAAKYLHRGKKLPCFRISKEGLGILIMHSRADKKNAERVSRIKDAYNKQFFAMEKAMPVIDSLKLAEMGVTDALQHHRKKLGKETEQKHYINENNMMDRILLGCSLKEFKQQQGHSDGKSLRDLLDAEQIGRLLQIRAENKRLIEEGIEYKYRKEQLADRFSRQQACIEGVVLSSVDPASLPSRF